MVNKHCCYGTCRSDSRYAGRKDSMQGVTFIPFPKPTSQPKKCKEWVTACYRSDFDVCHVTKDTYICTKHFVGGNGPTDDHPNPIPAGYSDEQVEKFCKKRKAPRTRSSPRKKTKISPKADDVRTGSDDATHNSTPACPTPPSSSPSPHEHSCVSTQTDLSMIGYVSSYSQTEHKDHDKEILRIKLEKKVLENEIRLLEDKMNFLKDTEMDKSEKQNDKQKTKEGQGSTHKFSLADVKDDDKIFKFYTGINYNHFESIWDLLGPSKYKLSYWNRDNADNEKSPKKKAGPDRKLDPKNEFFLTLVRLRLGSPHEDLAFRFGISSAHVSTVVITWIQFLFKSFKEIEHLFFPTLQTIPRKTIPKCFKKFKNIRIIIDCTEIFTQQSSDFGKQGNLYSNYKSHSTVKFLIGILPNGTIAFVSDGFEGSISDKEIVKQSGFLDKINPKDMVMADRGFLIKEELMKKKAHLNIPPFLGGRDKFTVKEEAKTKTIAKCRIHVERAIEKLKKFRIIKQTVPSSLSPMVSQMVFVIAMLVNHQQPLVR